MSRMKNLLEETTNVIIENGLNPIDIIYIGDGEYSCTWEEFQTISDIEYDSGYGGAEINEYLMIVFNNGVEMHRGEYDGSEWWDVHVPFKLKNLKEQKKLTGVESGW